MEQRTSDKFALMIWLVKYERRRHEAASWRHRRKLSFVVLCWNRNCLANVALIAWLPTKRAFKHLIVC